jgi:hypothetical protein
LPRLLPSKNLLVTLQLITKICYSDMTRKAWTTEPQREWLEARLAAFREAQHAKTTASVFFPQSQKAFKEEWPVEPPTNEEIADAGSIEKATANKNKTLNTVSNPLTYLSTGS